MSDEEGKAAPAVICRTIAPDHGVVAEEGRGCRVTQLRLLQARQGDAIFAQIDVEFLPGRVDAVAVELKETRSRKRRSGTRRTRRTRTLRAGIWSDVAGDEEEEEDERARERRSVG